MRLHNPTLCLILLLISFQGNANEQDVDDLTAQLQQVAEGTSEHLLLLLQVAQANLYRHPTLTEFYAHQLVPLSKQHGDQTTQVRALQMLGMANMYQGKNTDAVNYLTDAITLAKQTNDNHLLSLTHRSMGVYYELTIDFDSAMVFYIDALKYAKLSDNAVDLSMVYNNIGNVLNSQGDYHEAANYFQQAIAINQSIADFEMETNATVGLGISYLKAGDLDEAQQVFESVLAHEEKLVNFTHSEATVHLAAVYHQQGKADQAKNLYHYVISDSRGGAYPQAVALAYVGLGELFTADNQLEQALAYYREGIERIKNKTSVESEITLYENLAKLELRLGNYENAANVQAEYIARRNAVQPITKDGIINQLETQLAQEREQVSLQEALLAKERQSRAATLYLFTALVASLLSFILVLVLRLRKQKLQQLEASNKVLALASETDPLTGIGNRRYLEHQLPLLPPSQIAVLAIDIDHFKQLNDSYGHQAGDEVLALLATTLQTLCRKEDVLARIGGEEFVIIAKGLDAPLARTFAERIRTNVRSLKLSSGARITVSIGISVGDTHAIHYDALYKQADDALYVAKNNGRDNVQVHDVTHH